LRKWGGQERGLELWYGIVRRINTLHGIAEYVTRSIGMTWLSIPVSKDGSKDRVLYDYGMGNRDDPNVSEIMVA
jgi:hypothetical protein